MRYSWFLRMKTVLINAFVWVYNLLNLILIYYLCAFFFLIVDTFLRNIYHKMGASLIAQLVETLPAMQETGFDSWVRKIRYRRDILPLPIFLGFPCGSTGQESACNVGNLGSIPELGRSLGEGQAYTLQYSGLKNFIKYIG